MLKVPRFKSWRNHLSPCSGEKFVLPIRPLSAFLAIFFVSTSGPSFDGSGWHGVFGLLALGSLSAAHTHPCDED